MGSAGTWARSDGDEEMTLSLQGIVKGRQIELDRETGLPDGAHVHVTIVSPSPTCDERKRRLGELFGSCAADPTFAAAMAEIERQRQTIPPRSVDFHVASMRRS